MIWSATLDKEQVLSFGQGKHSDLMSISRAESLEDLTTLARIGKYIFIWPLEPAAKQLPRTILVHPGDEEDFYSFIGAFLPNVSPITSQIRVFNAKSLEDYTAPRDYGFSTKLIEAAVGLVLCEAVARMDRSNEVVRFRTCAATHGFALGRHLAQGFDASLLSRVSGAWHTARRISGEQKTGISQSSLIMPWDILCQLSKDRPMGSSGRSDDITWVCRTLLSHGEVAPATLALLLPPGKAITLSLGRTREDKVQSFERYASELVNAAYTGMDSSVVSFILGFLCSEISRGTLEHLPLLQSVSTSHPDSLLWYGLCAGLRKQGGVFSSMKGLGRLVLREMLRPVQPLDVPSCDIALSELLVLNRGRSKFPDIITASATYADVEIMPFVTSSFSILGRKESDRREIEPENQMAFDKVAVAQRIGTVVHELQTLQQEISGCQQPLPFDKKKPRRQRR